jgi:hypothetical protein
LGFDALWTRFKPMVLELKGFFKCNFSCILMEEGGNGKVMVFKERRE